MNIKTITPLGDRVLVKEHSKEKNKKTAGGMLIPDSATANDVSTAEVIAVGPGIYTQSGTLIPMTLKPGDIVVLPSFHQSQKIRLNGTDHSMLREAELLGVAEVDNS